MKRLFLTIFLSFVVGSIIMVNAVVVESEINITNNIFSGKGTITSFDVNEQGEVLICVNPQFSHKRYVMIFQQNGRLIKTFEFQTRNKASAGFSKNGYIALFESQSPYGMVLDENGSIISEYKDEEHKRYELVERLSYTYGDARFEKNIGKNRITKSDNETSVVFYEIESATSDFWVSWIIQALLTGCIFVSLFKRKHKHKNENVK